MTGDIGDDLPDDLNDIRLPLFIQTQKYALIDVHFYICECVYLEVATQSPYGLRYAPFLRLSWEQLEDVAPHVAHHVVQLVDRCLYPSGSGIWVPLHERHRSLQVQSHGVNGLDDSIV